MPLCPHSAFHDRFPFGIGGSEPPHLSMSFREGKDGRVSRVRRCSTACTSPGPPATVRWDSWLLRRSFDRFSSQLSIIYPCKLKFASDLPRSRADSISARTPPVGGQRCARCSTVGPPKWCNHLHSQVVDCYALKKYGVGGVARAR